MGFYGGNSAFINSFDKTKFSCFTFRTTVSLETRNLFTVPKQAWHRPIIRFTYETLPKLSSQEIDLLITFFSDRFGCRYRSMDTGIIYNNDMADFDIPGYEVVDNIHPSPFNFPEPRKRPFSSMIPTILTDHNGDVQVVIGASGGKRITTAVSLVRPSCHH